MEVIFKFIKNNIVAVLVGLLMYGGFLFYTYSGNSMCDCESTEQYKPNQSGTSGVNRFYHK